MGALREKMIAEMKLRNFSERTQPYRPLQVPQFPIARSSVATLCAIPVLYNPHSRGVTFGFAV